MKTKLPILNDKQLQAGIIEFIDRCAQIENDRVGLCQFLARLSDHSRFTLQYINRLCPKLSVPKLKLMERVGRGDFHPSLLDAVTPGECMLAKMDYQEQVRGIEEDGTVPVVIIDAKNDFGMTLLPIRALTSDQVNQISRVVGGKRVYISEDEQKAWLVDHRTNLATRPSLKADQPALAVVDGKLITLRKHATVPLLDFLDTFKQMLPYLTASHPLEVIGIFSQGLPDVLASLHKSTRHTERPPEGPDKGYGGNDNPLEGPDKVLSGVTNPPEPVAHKTPRKSSNARKVCAANAASR